MPAATRGIPIALLLAGAVGAALAHLGAVSMPFQLGAVMDAHGVTAGTAGIFGFCELGGLALAMLALARVVVHVPPARLALAGVALAAFSNLFLYAAALPFAAMCILAILTGIGYAAVFSATIAGVSASPAADRIFSLSSGGSVLVVSGLMALFPAISARYGTLGPFVGVAALLGLTAPLMLGLGWSGGPHLAAARSAGITRSPGAIAIYVAWGGFSLGSGVAWSFAERIGRMIGLQPGLIAFILCATLFIGIAGTLLAAFLVGRAPRLACAVVGLLGTALGLLLFAAARGPVLFLVGTLAFWVCSMFFYCVMLGTAALLDPSGRVGTNGGGFDRLGFACGAPLGGLILDWGTPALVGIAAFLICAVPGLCALPVLRRTLVALDPAPERQ